MENTLSEDAVEAGMHKYYVASLALTSEEDDFDLLFGQKEDSEAEGQVQSDDHL